MKGDSWKIIQLYTHALSVALVVAMSLEIWTSTQIWIGYQ